MQIAAATLQKLANQNQPKTWLVFLQNITLPSLSLTIALCSSLHKVLRCSTSRCSHNARAAAQEISPAARLLHSSHGRVNPESRYTYIPNQDTTTLPVTGPSLHHTFLVNMTTITARRILKQSLTDNFRWGSRRRGLFRFPSSTFRKAYVLKLRTQLFEV